MGYTLFQVCLSDGTIVNSLVTRKMLQIQILVFSFTYWTVVQAWAGEGEIQEVKPELFVA